MAVSAQNKLAHTPKANGHWPISHFVQPSGSKAAFQHQRLCYYVASLQLEYP